MPNYIVVMIIFLFVFLVPSIFIIDIALNKIMKKLENIVKLLEQLNGLEER